MGELFLKLFNMSIVASVVVLAVLTLRFTFKKVPRALVVVLWGFVGIRLICPFSFESAFSLIPNMEPITGETMEQVQKEVPENRSEQSAAKEKTISSDALVTDSVFDLAAIHTSETKESRPVETVSTVTVSDEQSVTTNPAEFGKTYSLLDIAAVVWLAGVAGMMIYSLVSYLRIRKMVREVFWYQENIWLCDHISTPFVLGIFKPKIYLPSQTLLTDIPYVVAHETAHLKRLDHFWKPLGFALLTVDWFNPVLWIAYCVLCRDIELACDEKVIRELGVRSKKPYSTALINCSVPRRMIAACPLAFGEVSVKRRVKTVLNYKKPRFWISVLAVLALVGVGVCFLTNPISEAKAQGQEQKNNNKPEETLTDLLAEPTEEAEQAKEDEALKVGDTLSIGFYEQDGDMDNGTERIHWTVLDVQDGTALLLSEKALDAKFYFGAWEGSDVQEWLNGEFYDTVFHDEYEKRVIVGDRDKVFLLSAEEAKQYFPGDVTTEETVINSARTTQYTEYAKFQSMIESYVEPIHPDYVAFSKNCKWWLRSTEEEGGACVDYKGTIYTGGEKNAGMKGIRPVIRISLEEVRAVKEEVLEQFEKNYNELNEFFYERVGHYEQDNKNYTPIEEEPIIWLMIAVKDGKALMISRDALDVQPFDTDAGTSADWKDSSLKEWLNTDFYNTVFNDDEKRIIAGEEGDKLFLLNETQVREYLVEDRPYRTGVWSEEEQEFVDTVWTKNYLHATLTRYGLSQAGATRIQQSSGIGRDLPLEERRQSNNANWYILTDEGTCAYVDYMGNITETLDEEELQYVGVRPAMWVELLP